MSDSETCTPHERLIAAAERFGTPLYVYDGDRIVDRLHTVQAALDSSARIFYSAKANPAVGLVALLTAQGVGLDACSPGDLVLADRAQIPREDITYTGYAATEAELRSAVARCATVVADGEQDGLLLARLDAGSIGVRVNPGIVAPGRAALQAGAPGAKFGVPIADVKAVAGRLADAGLKVSGLHVHLGSDLLDAAHHVAVLTSLRELELEVAWLNIGGGFGTPRTGAEREYDWARLGAAAREAVAEGFEVRVEPGGHLAIDAGWLITRVVRRQPGDAQRPTTLQVDASTNLVPSIPLYDAVHDVEVLGREDGRGSGGVRIAGQLMQAGDVLFADGPEAQEGDLLAIAQVGAYAASRATTFNERPRPAEVLLRQGEPLLLRRAETLEELFARDVPPDTG